MILAISVIIALVVWFFFARVTLYESSNAVQLTETGRLLVTFPKEAISRVRPGQAAILRIQEDPNQRAAAIPAIVFATDAQNGQAEILILDNDLPVDISPGELQGLVSVEVAYVTPVSLVLQATGGRTLSREVPVSPQTLEE